MSSSRAGSRTRPSCTACRPPWTHVIAVSWRNCSQTCLPGGSGCWPGSEPPRGATRTRAPRRGELVRLAGRTSTALRGARVPGAAPGHTGRDRDQAVRYGGSRPIPGSGPSYGPGQSHGFGPFPGPGPGAVPGQFNRAAGPAATPAPLFSPPGRGDRFTIGRTRDCDLCLADLSVSRRHAELVRGAGGWLLNDLGSHNGTRLNGWLVRETVPVRAGDRLEFGSAIFVLQDDQHGLTPAE